MDLQNFLYEILSFETSNFPLKGRQMICGSLGTGICFY